MPQEEYEQLQAAVSAEERGLDRAQRAKTVFGAIDTFNNFALPALAVTGPFGKFLGVTKKGLSLGGGYLADRAINRQTANLEAAQAELDAFLELYPELRIEEVDEALAIPPCHSWNIVNNAVCSAAAAL